MGWSAADIEVNAADCCRNEGFGQLFFAAGPQNQQIIIMNACWREIRI